MQLVDVADPALRDTDVLVEVRAIGVNPGEAFFRRVRSAQPGARVLLGWEFAGILIGAGTAALSIRTTKAHPLGKSSHRALSHA